MADLIASLRECISYDPLTGVFLWKVSKGSGVSRTEKGTVAGSKRHDGYTLIGVNGKQYTAQRLAFALCNGYFAKEVDHINGDPSDNRLTNLRAASHQQNIFNGKHRKNNTSGKKGVYQHANGRWRARIMVNYKMLHLGVFPSIDSAHAAYMNAARKYFGEFVRDT